MLPIRKKRVAVELPRGSGRHGGDEGEKMLSNFLVAAFYFPTLFLVRRGGGEFVGPGLLEENRVSDR